MKAPFIFMNEESEYFYIFPNVFFSKSKGALSEMVLCQKLYLHLVNVLTKKE